jgi:hypothetical protein
MTSERHPGRPIILGIAIVVASLILGVSFYLAREHVQTVRVVGAATTRTGSDIAKLRIFINRIVGPQEVRAGYQEIGRDVSRLLAALSSAGMAENEIQVNPASAYQNFNQQGSVTGFTVQQSVVVISGKVDTLQSLALRPDRLLALGIVIQSMQIEYYSSNLSDLKKQLLAEATVDARNRAEEIVRGTGMSIQGIESARAGVFQITEPFSTEVTDYGVYNTSTREKEITVTVAATFVVE